MKFVENKSSFSALPKKSPIQLSEFTHRYRFHSPMGQSHLKAALPWASRWELQLPPFWHGDQRSPLLPPQGSCTEQTSPNQPEEHLE